MPNIDDLSISVKSNVTSATNSIDKLITKLGALSASLGQVNTSVFSAMASGIRQISSASKGIDGDSAARITQLAQGIKQLGYAPVTQASKNIPKLATSIQQLAGTMNSIGVNQTSVDGVANISKAISRLGYTTVGKAVENIPQINTQLQSLVTTVNQLPSSANGISSLTQLSSALSKLGATTGTKAVENIPKLTNALNQMIATLSKAPQVSYNVIQLVNSLANLASQGSKVGTASNSLYNGFMRFGAGADYARKKSFSLASAIGKLYASYFLLFRLFGSIGKAIDISSSLTEVENVVNVTFGKYRDLLDDFTETSLQQYGIGELDAKKFASRYQSMGVAMGFTQEEMAKMSVELTKLTGDYASFYEAALGDVHEDMLAIFTGQTRPLRAYGLDLTQATLQEWALSEGMQVNIQDMTQMEKTMLRYQYVMANSEHVIGDFLRTSDSWHNMMTVLNGTLKQFGDTVGNVAINFLKPLVAWFNNAIVVVNEFAVSIMNALGKLFGWEYKYTPGGLTQDDADIVEDYGSALGGAADKAKKLKQQLQGFDELNVLTTNTPSSSGAGGGGSLDDYEFTQTNGLFNIEEVKETYESEIDSLYELGEYISTTISSGLRDIDWQEVYQGAKDFGFGLADFLNGLINPDLFGATGRTIAGALNTAIYSSLGFGTEFDFDEFGSSIAQGVNEFFDEFDFTAFGQNIVTWVKGLKESLLVAIAEIEWGDVLAGIGDILKSLDAETIATLFAFGTISSLFKTGLFGALGSALRGMTVLPSGLSTGITHTVSLIATAVKSAIIGAFAGWNIAKYLIFEYDEEISDELEKYGFDVYENLDEALQAEAERKSHEIEIFEKAGMEIPDKQKGVAYQAQLEIAKSINLENAMSDLGTDLAKQSLKISKTLKNFGISTQDLAQVTEKSFKRIAMTGDVFGTLSTAIPQYSQIIQEGVSGQFETMQNNANNVVTYLSETLFGDKFIRGLQNVDSETNKLASSFNTNYKKMSDSATESVDKISESNIKANDSIRDVTSGVEGSYRRMATNITNTATNISTAITGQFASLRTNTNNILSALNTETSNRLGTVRDTSNTRMGEIVSGANQRLGQLPSTIGNHMITANKKVQSYSWYSSGINLVDGLKNGISDQWSGNLYNKITDLASNLTSKLKKAFGIKSPSRLWRDEIGYYLTQGLEVGILGEEGHLATSIIGMGARLTNTMSGALTLATPSSLSSNYDFGVTSTMAHNFTADGSMAGNIAQGVRDGVYSAQAEQNALLREQNNLLLQILNKEGISMDDVYSGVVRKNRENFDRTGTNLLFA